MALFISKMRGVDTINAFAAPSYGCNSTTHAFLDVTNAYFQVRVIVVHSGPNPEVPMTLPIFDVNTR